MMIVRKKDQVNKKWYWKLVYIDPILSSPGNEVHTTISVHKTLKEAKEQRNHIYNSRI